ncbi:hypothetical protein DMN91_002950 [Ooceraea biroi]|uniref:Uncharacterized protein n=1 Tax=Ooceraea biroi TaxID=2015173 RepID=A0A3L8DY31_OOCBI|nr:hypothetical protein DMN91_002950 [Ooceraea biroi]
MNDSSIIFRSQGQVTHCESVQTNNPAIFCHFRLDTRSWLRVATVLRALIEETGNLLLHRRNAGAPEHIRVNDEERILRTFEENPQNSVRRVAEMLGLSRNVVHRILR